MSISLNHLDLGAVLGQYLHIRQSNQFRTPYLKEVIMNFFKDGVRKDFRNGKNNPRNYIYRICIMN